MDQHRTAQPEPSGETTKDTNYTKADSGSNFSSEADSTGSLSYDASSSFVSRRKTATTSSTGTTKS